MFNEMEGNILFNDVLNTFYLRLYGVSRQLKMMFVQKYTHTYIHTYAYIHSYMHTYIHIHTYIHTYIHILSKVRYLTFNVLTFTKFAH